MQVYTQAGHTVIDTHQFTIREEATTNGVYKFFVIDSKKLPLSDVLYLLYLCWPLSLSSDQRRH